MFKEKFLKIVTFLALFLSPIMAFAEEGPTFHKLNSPVTLGGNLIDFLQTIVESITYLAVPIIVLAFVYSGFYFVFASGKEKGLEKAKNIFLMTVIGTVIILGANLMLGLIQDTADEIIEPIAFNQNK